jgi:hypothetical protein
MQSPMRNWTITPFVVVNANGQKKNKKDQSSHTCFTQEPVYHEKTPGVKVFFLTTWRIETR